MEKISLTVLDIDILINEQGHMGQMDNNINVQVHMC